MMNREPLFLKDALIIFLFIFLSFSLMAQEESPQSAKEVKNSLYLELGGNGLSFGGGF